MMTIKTAREIALEAICHALKKEKQLHSSVLCVVVCAALNTDKRAASNYVGQAYITGLTRRSTERKNNGFIYRLASRFPEWGDKFQPEEKARQSRISDIVLSCKENSRVYQFDQLIRGCHDKSDTESSR